MRLAVLFSILSVGKKLKFLQRFQINAEQIQVAKNFFKKKITFDYRLKICRVGNYYYPEIAILVTARNLLV